MFIQDFLDSSFSIPTHMSLRCIMVLETFTDAIIKVLPSQPLSDAERYIMEIINRYIPCGWTL